MKFVAILLFYFSLKNVQNVNNWFKKNVFKNIFKKRNILQQKRIKSADSNERLCHVSSGFSGFPLVLGDCN